MRQSENINELTEALAKARSAFKPIEKDAYNPYFKSKYASFDNIYKATEPGLTKNGLVVVQAPDYQDGKMVLITRLVHSSGQWIESSAPLLPVKDDSQSLGSAITYMKRYSWAVMMGLPGTETEDDGEAERKREEEDAVKQPISAAEVAELKKFINGDKERMANMLSWLAKTHQIDKIEEMPKKVYEKLRPGLKSAYDATHAQESKIEEIAF